jgi:hypothetical protein
LGRKIVLKQKLKANRYLLAREEADPVRLKPQRKNQQKNPGLVAQNPKSFAGKKDGSG